MKYGMPQYELSALKHNNIVHADNEDVRPPSCVRFWRRQAAAAACLDPVEVPWLRQLKPRTSRTSMARPPLMREMVAAGKSSVCRRAKYEGDQNIVGFASCFKQFWFLHRMKELRNCLKKYGSIFQIHPSCWMDGCQCAWNLMLAYLSYSQV